MFSGGMYGNGFAYSKTVVVPGMEGRPKSGPCTAVDGLGFWACDVTLVDGGLVPKIRSFLSALVDER
jgi:hypothetical protein